MGGFLHLFDFNQGNMARKVRKQKRHVGGLEAPQNSLEPWLKTPQSYCAIGDVTYSHQVEEWSEKNRYPIEASMKKLINEEVSKQSNTRQKAPSIVARLMGVDTLPLDTKSVVQPIAKKNENMGIEFSKKERSRKSSVGLISHDSNSPMLMEFKLSHNIKDRSADRWSSEQNLGNPRRQEHPQEEELQKFKKEFEAWQAARFKECSRVIGLDCTPGRLLAQEDLNKEKALYATSGRTVNERPREPESHTLKARSWERGNFEQHGDNVELFACEQKESLALRSRTLSREFEQSSLVSSSQKQEKSFAPTKIVILKPGLARISNHEESLISSLDTLEGRGSIEDFLDEVKERLKCELQGYTSKRGSVGRGSGIETPFSEKLSDQKLIARNVAKQVRDGVTKDHGKNLPRSESARSYRSETQLNGPGSWDFISRDGRKLLSERQFDIPTATSSSSAPDNEKVNIKQVRDTLKAGNEVSCGEIVNDEQEIQTRSFRHGSDDGVLLRELSPRNLIRSLSAPVSGTSFGKLLLEDRHILTGAHIRRKHEAIDNVTVDIRKQRKERFTFKERVSNFRYSFTFRKRLFGKRRQSMVESYCSEHTLTGGIMSGPTVLMNHGERHENSTEVPPSPASVCNSALEDFWRPTEHISSMSTPDVTPTEDDVVPQVFIAVSSNVNDLRKQPNQLKSLEPEDASIEWESNESEIVDLEDPTEAYIRDLLVSSGLYDGSCDISLFSCISNSVFEEVEESYRDLAKKDQSTMKDHNEKVNHRMLFDLLNETLSTSLRPISTMSKFKRKFIHFSTLPTLLGRGLLNHVWGIIHVLLQPLIDKSHCSLDGLVARDLGSTPWSVFTDEEVNGLGREVECLIIGDLVDEIVKDMQLRGCEL